MKKIKMDKYSVFSTVLDSNKIKTMTPGMDKIIVKLVKPEPKKEMKTTGGIIIPQQVLDKKDPRKLLKMGIVLATNPTGVINNENVNFIDDIEIGDIIYINDLSGIHFEQEEGTFAIIKYEEILAYTKFDKLNESDKEEIKKLLEMEKEEK